MRATKQNPAAGNCGARNTVCLAANSPENSRIERPPQAQFARLRRQRLERHVATVLRFPPWPRQIGVRISAADASGPIGRTRPLRLTEHDFETLIETAQRLEARA
jgi:hypothetical protein